MKLRISLFVVLFLFLLSSPNEVAAKRVIQDETQIKIVYDNRIVQGHDTQISIQIRFNMSEIEVLMGKNETRYKTVFHGGPYDSWITDDWVDILIGHNEISEPGTYKLRAVAYPQNKTFPAITSFFEFFVEKVLNEVQIKIMVGIIVGSCVMPFLYTKHKRMIEKKLWNNLSFFIYLKWWGSMFLKLITILTVFPFLYKNRGIIKEKFQRARPSQIVILFSLLLIIVSGGSMLFLQLYGVDIF